LTRLHDVIALPGCAAGLEILAICKRRIQSWHLKLSALAHQVHRSNLLKTGTDDDAPLSSHKKDIDTETIVSARNQERSTLSSGGVASKLGFDAANGLLR
jgi:hypothetical protein